MDLWNEPVFRALVQSWEDCLFTLDQDEVITGLHYTNGGGLLPLADAQAVGKRFDQVFPAEVSLTFRTAIQTLGSTGLPQTVSFTLRVDQQRRYYSARLTRPRFEDGTELLVVVIWDVTGEELARKVSRENELVYQLLAENSSDIVSVEDIDGRYIYVSPSVERMLGYTVKEVVGRNRLELLHPEDVSSLRPRGDEPFPPLEGARLRFRVRHKEERWVWVESEVRPIEWQGGPALLSTARDVSKRHVAEERASSSRSQLEEARTRAEDANRAKSEFLASISHDLRTPLHGLLGMAELLEQTHLTNEQQEYLSAIQESGDTLLARLNDLLDLSKIESGQLDLQGVDFDLVEAVEGLIDILGGQATSRGIHLFCHVNPGVPPVVSGDPQRLRQVLINLIGNAIKFTDQGEVDVRVSVTGQDEGERIRFSVRDTGQGIAPELADRILGNPGVAPPPGRSRRHPGVGLGLTIARQLVALMGGQLQLESARGAGSTLFFELPLPPSERKAIELQGTLLSGRRILASDENATNRQLIREHLEQSGAEVELTSGGVEAIRNLLDDPAYDCVILNSILPDLDGLSTAAMIRSNRTLEQLPLVLMISSAEPDEVQRCRELKVNATLTKPIRRDVLVRAVHAVVTSGGFSEGGAAAVGDATILVVEDNEVNLRLARDILRRAGYSVVSARDGKEALKQMEQQEVDAILMDIQLPDMDGIEATERLRETPAWAEIPIIAMTAHAMKGDAERFLAAGVDTCLSKPVNQTALLNMLARELARRREALGAA